MRFQCKGDHYSPAKINQADSAKDDVFRDVRREACIVSLKDSYLKKHFNIVHAADDMENALVNDRRKLVNQGPIASFSANISATSSGKFLKSSEIPYVKSLIQKLLN